MAPAASGGGISLMKIKMLKTVRPTPCLIDLPFFVANVPADTVLVCGEVYEAVQNGRGAVFGICKTGGH